MHDTDADAATGLGPHRPPVARRGDTVEFQAGQRIADPYRWLEGPRDDPEVAAFVTEQNDAARTVLDALPARSALADSLRLRFNHPRRSAPWRRGRWWFQLRNDGLQDQDVLWCAPAAHDQPGHHDVAPDEAALRVLIDPNTFSAHGTVSLSGLAVSNDGARVAFACSQAGSDWLVWDVVDTATGRVHDEPVHWARFSGAAWLPDGSGYLYGGYPPPEPGAEHTAQARGQRLQLHRLGTDAAADRVVYTRTDRPEWGFEPVVSHDGRFVIVRVWHGTHPTTRVHVAPLRDGEIGAFRPLLDRGDARYEVLGVLDDDLVVVTDLDAPLGRVATVSLADLDDPAAVVLRPRVAEHTDRLERVTLVGGQGPDDPAWLVCRRLHHGAARLVVHDARTGARCHEIDLPGLGTVASVTGGRDTRAVHLTYTSFDTPTSVLRHDLEAATTHTVHAVTRPGSPVVIEQVRVHHDEVAVPMFLVHRGDVRPTGQVPTLLWDYGGFDIAVTPTYQPAFDTWVEAGGLLAIAGLRGGGEYGRAWHDAGRLDNKTHVFDDALACAAWLTGRRRDEVTASALTDDADPKAVWSAPRHLGIEGRSNGGLLVGACVTREPEAFGSAVAEVGVLDLARFHRFTIGWAWTSDYGNPEDPRDLAVLLRYSPYHQLREGRAYPPTLITTGDTDDRVVPLHSYKFAAALQHAQAGDAPVLLRVDIAAGHGAGKPISKLLEERTDVLAFHAHHLGLDPASRVTGPPTPAG